MAMIPPHSPESSVIAEIACFAGDRGASGRRDPRSRLASVTGRASVEAVISRCRHDRHGLGHAPIRRIARDRKIPDRRIGRPITGRVVHMTADVRGDPKRERSGRAVRAASGSRLLTDTNELFSEIATRKQVEERLRRVLQPFGDALPVMKLA